MAEANGMTIIAEQIKKGEFSSQYLLFGDEKYLIDQYKKNLCGALIDTEDTMNFSVFKGDSVKLDAFSELADTMPFFADRRVILIEDSGYFKKGNDDVEKFLEKLPETTVIIFVEQQVDKRTKLYKAVAKNGTVAPFQTPDEKTLLVWMKGMFRDKGYQVEDVAIYRLVEGVGSNMNMLVQEAEKLMSYCYEDKIITAKHVDYICVNQTENKIFEMMEALSKKDAETTISLYNDLLTLREPAMRVMFLITRQFQLLLKCKVAMQQEKTNGQIASILKLPPFVVKKYTSQCQGYTYDELVECVNFCQDTDRKIKTGQLRDTMAVELLIFNLMK